MKCPATGRWLARIVVAAVAALGVLVSIVFASPPTERQRFAEALEREGVTSKDRALLHLSHTCDLTIDRATYLVLDVREIIPHMAAPRGINQIVVLDAALRRVIAIRYYDQRPLDCYGPRLLLFGALEVESDEHASSGNLLVFSRGGASVRAETFDVREGPPR